MQNKNIMKSSFITLISQDMILKNKTSAFSTLLSRTFNIKHLTSKKNNTLFTKLKKFLKFITADFVVHK